MFVALTDQKSGNSTPFCSKLIEPSRQFVITTSRRSQVTSSYGWTPGVVLMRATVSPLRGRLPLRAAGPLVVSVMTFLPPAASPARLVLLIWSCSSGPARPCTYRDAEEGSFGIIQT